MGMICNEIGLVAFKKHTDWQISCFFELGNEESAKLTLKMDIFDDISSTENIVACLKNSFKGESVERDLLGFVKCYDIAGSYHRFVEELKKTVINPKDLSMIFITDNQMDDCRKYQWALLDFSGSRIITDNEKTDVYYKNTRFEPAFSKDELIKKIIHLQEISDGIDSANVVDLVRNVSDSASVIKIRKRTDPADIKNIRKASFSFGGTSINVPITQLPNRQIAIDAAAHKDISEYKVISGDVENGFVISIPELNIKAESMRDGVLYTGEHNDEQFSSQCLKVWDFFSAAANYLYSGYDSKFINSVVEKAKEIYFHIENNEVKNFITSPKFISQCVYSFIEILDVYTQMVENKFHDIVRDVPLKYNGKFATRRVQYWNSTGDFKTKELVSLTCANRPMSDGHFGIAPSFQISGEWEE